MQYFAHKGDSNCSAAPETEAHLLLKRMTVEAARTNGWDVETEAVGTTASGEQWKADVLARKGDHKMAIEIQWSAQTNEETLRRQARYALSGVRCYWLMRQRKFPISHALPAARIGGSPEEGFIALVPTGSGEQSVPMRDFLNAAFNNRLRFGVPLESTANVSVRAGHMSCWFCGGQTQIITGVDLALGPNEFQFSVPDLGRYPDLFEIVHSHLPSDLEVGAIKSRFSKTQERVYLSNGCVHCDALIGEFHEHGAWENQEVVCKFPIRVNEPWRRAIQDHDSYEEGWGVYPAG